MKTEMSVLNPHLVTRNCMFQANRRPWLTHPAYFRSLVLNEIYFMSMRLLSRFAVVLFAACINTQIHALNFVECLKLLHTSFFSFGFKFAELVFYYTFCYTFCTIFLFSYSHRYHPVQYASRTHCYYRCWMSLLRRLKQTVETMATSPRATKCGKQHSK